MARIRQTPTCMFCGAPSAKAVYDQTAPADFIGDTFLRWETIPHTCPAKEEWENDHPQMKLHEFITMKQQERKKALKRSVFIPVPAIIPDPPPSLPDPPALIGRLSKTQIEEVEGGIKVIRLPEGHAINCLATGTLEYQKEGTKTVYFVLYSYKGKGPFSRKYLLIGTAGSLRQADIVDSIMNTDIGMLATIYRYNDRVGTLYLRMPFREPGPGNSNSHPDFPLLNHGKLRILEIPGKSHRALLNDKH